MIGQIHLHFASCKNTVLNAEATFQAIKSDVSKLLFTMLKSAAYPPMPMPVPAAPPAMLQLSDEMSRLTMSSGHPSSDPFDSLTTNSVILEAERINQM